MPPTRRIALAAAALALAWAPAYRIAAPERVLRLEPVVVSVVEAQVAAQGRAGAEAEG